LEVNSPGRTSPVELGGQVAVVTGGGSGLGREIARQLAAAGAGVAVIARSRDPLAATVALIEDAGGRAFAVAADVTDRAAVEEAVESIEQHLGPIDLLVNNAGTSGPVAPMWEADPDQWWAAVETNFRGAFLCCWAVLPGQIARKAGRIVNVTSNAGVYRWPYLSAYATSKAAVIKLTENLAVETKKHGVKLFSINPGMLRAGMTESLLEAEVPADSPVALVAEWFKQEMESGQEVPLERGAELITFVASGGADALSGRYFSVYDDVHDLIGRAASIRRDDLYTLRLREA
jgi:NAD(P)-dependent dehydrogenase (short-subunit alcohol dehydrogenase family)